MKTHGQLFGQLILSIMKKYIIINLFKDDII